MKIGSLEWKKKIIKGSKSFNIDISQEQLDLFSRHAKELLIWNKKINLTSIIDPNEVAIKHYVDSIVPFCNISKDSKIIDIGSGGGFPGIPIKIINPLISLTLIDASNKKINFLKHIIRILKLDNCIAEHIRADSNEINKNKDQYTKKQIFLKSYDVVVSRALSNLYDFVLMAIPYIKKDGIIIALKGGDISSEIEVLNKNKHKLLENSVFYKHQMEINVKKYLLPIINNKRSIVTVKFVKI